MIDDKGRIERIPYELCALGALRDAIRRREIWVDGKRACHPKTVAAPWGYEDTLKALRSAKAGATNKPANCAAQNATPKPSTARRSTPPCLLSPARVDPIACHAASGTQ